MSGELLNKSQKPQILVITGISGAGRLKLGNRFSDDLCFIVD